MLLIRSSTEEIGIAYPMPSTPSPELFAELIPIRWPFASNSPPPLLPALIAASICIILLVTLSSDVVTSLLSALTWPNVVVWPRPSAFPIAITPWPTLTSSELSIVATEIAFKVSSGMSDSFTAKTAISASESAPFKFASTSVPSTNVTFLSFVEAV